MFKSILIAVAILIVAFVAVVATRPSDFRVSRSAVIPAPPAAVFAQINDFHKWDAWSPWAKMDPDSKVTFSGPASGEGAEFAWSGNDKVGEGTMTIVKTVPDSLVLMKLEFRKPFEGTSMTEFTFTPAGEATNITWTMSGTNNFVGKAMGLFMDCDKMVGSQFEQGLANLKSVVQNTAP